MRVVIDGQKNNADKCPESDFERCKIPLPGGGIETEGSSIVLNFRDSEEALKYGIHLGDVLRRIEGNPDYKESVAKIKAIISSITRQADYKSLEFPEA